MGGSAPAPVVIPPSGGFFADFGEHLAVKDRKRRERLEAEESVKEIADSVDREIAQFLRVQEMQDAQREDLERLRRLAERAQAERDALTAQSLAVLDAQLSTAALMRFERELRRQIEEEEAAILMILFN